jgi:hypothetical protein
MNTAAKPSAKVYLSFVMGAIWAQGQSLHAQNLFSNDSFESGTYGASSSAFAGQTANGANNTGSSTTGVTTGWSIDNWSFVAFSNGSFSNGNVDRWVSDGDRPVMAQSGSKYIYLSTTSAAIYGNSSLQYGTSLNFTAGNTYRFSFYAADANSAASGAKIGFEIIPFFSSPATSQYVTLTRNQNWSDTVESTVPWVQYTIDWIPSATVTGANFYWSALSSVQGSQANVVLDNISLTDLGIIPEPETLAAGVFMSTLLGFTWLKRRTAKT